MRATQPRASARGLGKGTQAEALIDPADARVTRPTATLARLLTEIGRKVLQKA